MSETSLDKPESNIENDSLSSLNEIELDPIAALNAGLAQVMSRDKSVAPDTPGVYAPYPSHDACVVKVAEMIAGTGVGYYQYVSMTPTHVLIETMITHAGGEQIATGGVTIPIAVTKNPSLGIAAAIGWAKRLSLVHAFSLGTKELPPEELQEIQSQKAAVPEAVVLDKIEL